MGLPSYVINFDELADLLELELEEATTRAWYGVAGESTTKSFYTEVPPMANKYRILSWEIKKDIKLTSVSYGQTAWKSEDSWTLMVDGDEIFSDIYTKELTDKKHWEIVEDVEKGSRIELVLNNRSGNHRGVWVQFEYIEMLEVGETV